MWDSLFSSPFELLEEYENSETELSFEDWMDERTEKLLLNMALEDTK